MASPIPDPEHLTEDMVKQNKSLLAAFAFPPKPCDSERKRSIMPCMQCHTDQMPEGWPTNPPISQVMDARFYAGLGNEALFFMFYYEEGSWAQVMASKALKAKNWRFHKQYNHWFHRLEQPKVVTADFERGNYTYWDVASWSEKVKMDMTFEYRFLENGSTAFPYF